ncbi:AgmX/PglI C-terminal domain-containing protein [Myxococcota bacterium]|nr:AgmX/PglI C-terminal domain-containing protein [Myxococcota bacterium]MBU1383064.1 AgmX/PglI C-terminal domain-containing protein [Myxococcota bacterium]MBU1497599.1 AgmX/PglI C-terminal domain-containing protein [Myxococcota bacterium]
MKYIVFFLFLLTNCYGNPSDDPIPLKPNLFFSKSGNQIDPLPSTIFIEVRGRDVFVEGVRLLSLDKKYKVPEHGMTFNISFPLFYGLRAAMCEAVHTPDSKGEFLRQKSRKSFELFRSCTGISVHNAAFLFPENLPAETIKSIVRTALEAGIRNIGILEPKGNHEFYLRNIDEFYFNLDELNEYSKDTKKVLKKKQDPREKTLKKESNNENSIIDIGIFLNSPKKSIKFPSIDEFNHMFSNEMFLYYFSKKPKLKNELKSTLIQTFFDNYILYDGFLPVSDLFKDLTSNQFQLVSSVLRHLLKLQSRELLFKLRKDRRTLEVLKSLVVITEQYYCDWLYDDIKKLLNNIYKNPEVMDPDSSIRYFLANHILDFNKGRTSKKESEAILISLLGHGNHTASTEKHFCNGKYCMQDFRVNQMAAKTLGKLDLTPEIITSLVSCIFSQEYRSIPIKSNYTLCSDSILKLSKKATPEQIKLLKSHLLLTGTGDPELTPQIFDVKSRKFGTNLKKGSLENFTTVCQENFWIFKHSYIYENIEKSDVKFPADLSRPDAVKTACTVFKIAKENNMLRINPYAIESNVLILLKKLGFSDEYKSLGNYLCNDAWKVAFEEIEKSWTSKTHRAYFQIYNLRKSVRKNFCKHAQSGFKKHQENTSGKYYPGSGQPIDLLFPVVKSRNNLLNEIDDRGKIHYTNLNIFGKISPIEIESVFQLHLNEIRHCFQKALMQDNKMEGLVRVEFQIDPPGNVITCKIVRNLSVETVGNCICKRLSNWKFPDWKKHSVTPKDSIKINHTTYLLPN